MGSQKRAKTLEKYRENTGFFIVFYDLCLRNVTLNPWPLLYPV